MIKTKRIVCPHCREAHIPGSGYFFDEKLSIVCDKCKKTIFPSTPEAEVGIPKTTENKYNSPYRNQWHQKTVDFA